MNWRPSDRVESDPNLPSLRFVLEHYGVHVGGRNVQSVLCPMHQERTPSCSVNLDRGVWFCHACGEHGGTLRLIALKEGVPIGRARSVAAALKLAEGGIGTVGDKVSGSVYGGRRAVPQRKRNSEKRRGFLPSWRRR